MRSVKMKLVMNIDHFSYLKTLIEFHIKSLVHPFGKKIIISDVIIYFFLFFGCNIFMTFEEVFLNIDEGSISKSRHSSLEIFYKFW